MNALIWYEVTVTEDGRQLDIASAGNLEMARRAVTRFRVMHPTVEWIKVNRVKRGRRTALIALTVHRGTTAAERREAAVREVLA